MAAGSLVLPVVMAVYVVMVFNPAFWNRYLVAAWGFWWAGAPPQFAALPVLILGFTGCLSLLNFRFLLRPSLVVLLIATSVLRYFIDQDGPQINWSMVQHLLDSDTGNAEDLLFVSLGINVVVFGILPSWMLSSVDLRFAPFHRQLLLNVIVAGILLGLAILLGKLSEGACT